MRITITRSLSNNIVLTMKELYVSMVFLWLIIFRVNMFNYHLRRLVLITVKEIYGEHLQRI